MAANFAENRKILITGATDGIGKATAQELAALGARVIIHGRNLEKAETVIAEIGGSVEPRPMIADFASLREVRELARQVKNEHPDLCMLINNAGLYSDQKRTTEDGHDLSFQVNHLSPFLLTLLLVDLLKSNAPARIVTVSSTLHQGAELDFGNLQAERSYEGHDAYGTSKLANALFARELAERLEGTDVTSNYLHPGGVNTKLLRAGFGGGGISPREGARTSVRLAADPGLQKISGKYFVREKEAEPDHRVEDADLRKRLWEYCEERVKPYLS